MEYNEYLFTQLAEEILKDFLNKHYYDYDSRYPVIIKLYEYFKLTNNGDGDLYQNIEEFLEDRKKEAEKHGSIKLNKIEKEALLKWLFYDYSDSLSWFTDFAYKKLYAKRELCVNLNDITKLIGYIPGHLCEIKLDTVEYDPREVIFI